MELILASNNTGKILEIAALLPDLQLRSLRDIGYTTPIEEPFDTFRENALIKAQTLYDLYGIPVLSDDSGICVDALQSAPGVHSARFAGPNATDAANNSKLLAELQGAEDRSAHYVAVLCLIIGGEVHYFEGRCDGSIALEPSGSAGFGYDPLFIPKGCDRTFGEIDPAIKSRISHRAKALEALTASGLLAEDSTIT